MARIFTTSFEFNRRSCDAVVTVIPKGNELSFIVKVLDDELQQFLPVQISYTGCKGFEQLATLNNVIAQSLMRCLSEAIEKHLQDTK